VLIVVSVDPIFLLARASRWPSLILFDFLVATDPNFLLTSALFLSDSLYPLIQFLFSPVLDSVSLLPPIFLPCGTA
jgi:hypothetical protein